MTIIILTLSYILAFLPMIIENVLWLSNSPILADNSYYLYYIMVSYPGQILSAVNPVIIISRSRELQSFLGKCFLGRCSGRSLFQDFNTSQGIKVAQLREMYVITAHNAVGTVEVVERFDGVPTYPSRQLYRVERKVSNKPPLVGRTNRLGSKEQNTVEQTGNESKI